MNKRISQLLLAALVACLLLAFSTGCQMVPGKDGESRKVITPLKMVPDGDYAKLKATTASPWTGSTTATAAEQGLEVKDGRAVSGGYSVLKTTPFGFSFGFVVELAEPKQEVEDKEETEPADNDTPPPNS